MADDNYKMVLNWSAPNGSLVQNILYCHVDGGDSADVGDLLDDIAAVLGAKLASWFVHLVASWVLDTVTFYAFNAATGVSTPIGSRLLGIAGTGSGQPIPGGCAMKLSIYVDGRPRPAGIYLPGFTSNDLTSTGTADATALAAAALVASRLCAPSALPTVGLAYEGAYWSKKDSAMVNILGETGEANDVVDYQRRRKAGVGV